MQRFMSLRLLTKSKTSPLQYFTTTLSNPSKNFPGFLVNKVFQRSNDMLKAQNKGLLDLKWVFSTSHSWGKLPDYGPSFDSDSHFSKRTHPDKMIRGLVAANVVIFLLFGDAGSQFMREHFMISVDNFSSGRLHTLVLSAFSHIDGGHLISNMIGLYFFGKSIGRAFGPKFLLKLYLAGALVGSVFHWVYHASKNPSKSKQIGGMNPSSMPGLGTSGAVTAITLLDMSLACPKMLLIGLPRPAILLGIFLIIKDMSRMIEGDTQVSRSAHLGGAAVAWAFYRKCVRTHVRTHLYD